MNQFVSRHSLLAVLAVSLALVSIATSSCGRTPEPAPAAAPENTVELREGWKIRAAAESTASGADISSRGFDTAGWTATTVPSTVLAAQVQSGEIEDPYFGRNLEQIPAEPYAGPWWYRTEFSIDGEPPAGARLVFEGINYSADVWLNGQKIGDRTEFLGAFRIFELDITPYLAVGNNVLAVEVHPPEPGDPTIGFVDWNPTPPDRNMGLWRGVNLRLTGDVSLDHVFVQTDLDLPSLERAALTIRATVALHVIRN